MTETLLFEDARAWEQWLESNADNAPDVWLKIAKKTSTRQTITIMQALDVALCFGWIDSQRVKLDDDFYLQRYSPRRKKSNWSQINIDKAKALMQAGKMRETGLREVELAKVDGRWR